MSRSFKHNPYVSYISRRGSRKSKTLLSRAFRRISKYCIKIDNPRLPMSWKKWKGKSMLHDDYYKTYYGKNYSIRSSLDFMDWQSWRKWSKK